MARLRYECTYDVALFNVRDGVLYVRASKLRRLASVVTQLREYYRRKQRVLSDNIALHTKPSDVP